MSHRRADHRRLLRRLIPFAFGLLVVSPGLARADDASAIVDRARGELSRVSQYAGEWLPVSGYPLGDVAPDRGACTDLVVRALRAVGIDLQELVHEDILRAREAYGVRVPDPQVDHRRVAVLLTYFQRNVPSLSLARGFHAGDIVFFGAGRGTPRGHVAVVSDRVGPRGRPLVLENGGPRPTEGDTLDARPIVGHFRVAAPSREVAVVLRALLAD